MSTYHRAKRMDYVFGGAIVVITLVLTGMVWIMNGVNVLGIARPATAAAYPSDMTPSPLPSYAP